MTAIMACHPAGICFCILLFCLSIPPLSGAEGERTCILPFSHVVPNVSQ
jgi:hypothetical protein